MPVNQQRTPSPRERKKFAADLDTDYQHRMPKTPRAQVRFLSAELSKSEEIRRTLTKQRDDALTALNSRANYRRQLAAFDETLATIQTLHARELAKVKAQVETIQRIFRALGGQEE